MKKQKKRMLVTKNNKKIARQTTKQGKEQRKIKQTKDKTNGKSTERQKGDNCGEERGT